MISMTYPSNATGSEDVRDNRQARLFRTHIVIALDCGDFYAGKPLQKG